MKPVNTNKASKRGEAWVLIDVGCHECGVGSEYVGTYKTNSSANRARVQLSEKTGNWRDGGQSIPQVFKIKLPPQPIKQNPSSGESS